LKLAPAAGEQTSACPVAYNATGIFILVVPRLLNFIVAIYLIIVGITGLGLLR
jgi:hypothetical protein